MEPMTAGIMAAGAIGSAAIGANAGKNASDAMEEQLKVAREDLAWKKGIYEEEKARMSPIRDAYESYLMTDPSQSPAVRLQLSRLRKAQGEARRTLARGLMARGMSGSAAGAATEAGLDLRTAEQSAAIVGESEQRRSQELAGYAGRYNPFVGQPDVGGVMGAYGNRANMEMGTVRSAGQLIGGLAQMFAMQANREQAPTKVDPSIPALVRNASRPEFPVISPQTSNMNGLTPVDWGVTGDRYVGSLDPLTGQYVLNPQTGEYTLG